VELQGKKIWNRSAQMGWRIGTYWTADVVRTNSHKLTFGELRNASGSGQPLGTIVWVQIVSLAATNDLGQLFSGKKLLGQSCSP
jgi:hypothetical protein